MTGVKRWSVMRLDRFGDAYIVCEFPCEGGCARSVRVVSPAHRRRIDFDPWRIIERMSREVEQFIAMQQRRP